METKDPLLGLEQVHEWIGVPVNTLRYWRSQKVGPKSARMGRRVVYRQSDIQAWIDRQFEEAS